VAKYAFVAQSNSHIFGLAGQRLNKRRSNCLVIKWAHWHVCFSCCCINTVTLLMHWGAVVPVKVQEAPLTS